MTIDFLTHKWHPFLYHFRCPYYISRELSKSVDILFAPYNYLIDPGNRRSLNGIPWDNAVLIFDEAHNLVRSFFCLV
jgi:Rad3-related DNA helicase